MIKFLRTKPTSKISSLLALAGAVLLSLAPQSASAQIAGPYQYFEGVPASTGALATNGWQNSITSTAAGTSSARSGRYAVIMNTTTKYVQTPQVNDPGLFTFYYRCLSATWGFTVTYSASATGTSPTTIATYTGSASTAATTPNDNGYLQAVLDLAALGVPAGSYVRINCGTTNLLYMDDFSLTASTPSLNTILVMNPYTGFSSATNFSLGANTSYTFYDQGGNSDKHNANQNNNVTFTPASGQQIKLSFISFTTGSTSTGTCSLTNTSPALSGYTGTTVPPGTPYLGTAADAVVGFNLTSTTSTSPNDGFVVTVESIPASITCNDVTNVKITNSQIGSTTAQITWSLPTPNASSYDYYVSTSSTAPTSGTTPTGNITGSTTTSYTLTGLMPATTYYVWVRSNCGGGSPNWVQATVNVTGSPNNFTTRCSAYPIPYTEDFNGLNGPLPVCTYTDYPAGWNTNIAFGNLFGYADGTNFYTKPVSLTAGTTYRLTYDYYSSGGGSDLSVYYGTTNVLPTAGNVATNIATYFGISSVVSTDLYDFTPGSTGTYYIRFALDALDNPGVTSFNLDNVHIEVESCFPPTGVTASAQTASTVHLAWTAPVSGSPAGYDYYLSTSPTPPTYGTPATGTTTNNFADVSGLLSGTKYYVWVRSNCGPRGSIWTALSSWTGHGAFNYFQTDIIVVTTVNMPTSGSGISTGCATYNFFDSGGASGDYVNGESGSYTFTGVAGKQLKVSFSSFNTESGWDGLLIYDGPNTGSPLIASGLPAGVTAPANSYYGTTSPGTIISTNGTTSTAPSLTFKFNSDTSIVRSGWAATITCVTAPVITSFTPTNNSCGTYNGTVVITGNNFSGANPVVTNVLFNGVPAASFTVNSNTQITAQPPAGVQSGFITVVNTEASTVSTTAYQVLSPAPVTTGTTICAGASGTITSAAVCTGYNNAVTTINGAFSGSDPVAPRLLTSSANSPICGFAATTSPYTAIQFQVSVTGTYTLELSGTPTFDGMAYIASGAFTPGSCATGTFIVGDDDSGAGLFPQLSTTLVAGVTYTLYTTIWSSANVASATNAYTWTINSPAGSVLLYSNAQVAWYTASSGGTAIGSGSPFNPVGVPGSGLANTNTAGTYTYYAACPSNPTCRTATTFVIEPIPVAGTVSANQTICYNTAPANMTLTGSAGNIQWQSSPDGTTWTNITGATSATLTGATVGPLTATRYYHAVLSTTTCGTATSPTITVTVNPLSVAGSISPASATVCTGTNSTLLTLTGYTGTIQWESSPNNVTWTPIGGATSATYTVTNISANTYYHAVVKSGVCSSATTASVLITVSPASVAGTIGGAPATVCAGTNSTLLTLTGNTGTIQWQSSPNAFTWTNILGATSSTYTASNLNANTYYRVVVTSGGCSSANSGSVLITVNPQPVAGTASSPQTICPGNTPANLTLAGSTGSIQWQSSPDNTAWTNIPGATTATLTGATIGPLASTRYFRAVVSSGVCTSVNSNTVIITVTNAVGGTISPASQSVCSAATPLTLTGYVGTISKWQWDTTAAFPAPNDIAVTTATLSAAQIGTFSGTRYYRAVITSGTCTAFSSTADISFTVTVWTGSWSAGAPTASTGAVFNANYTSSGNLSACSVTVMAGANVTFNTGHVLTVQNGVTVNAGATLTFENASSLIQVNDAAVNSGYITYKRDSQQMRKFDYTYWGSPLSPQTFVGLSPLTLADKYFAFNTASNSYVNVPGNSLMNPGQGYIIRAPQNFDPTTPQVFHGIFNGGSNDGVPNNGVITYNIVTSGSNVMNLLGNPYPCALNADAFLIANASVMDGTMYFWTHNTAITSNQYTGSDYAIYNLGGGVGTSAATNPGVNMQVPNGHVGAGQGFFVKGKTPGGAAVYNNSMREGNNTQFYRPAAGHALPGQLEKNRVWLEMKNESGGYKQLLVGYIETATNDRDSFFDSDMVDAGYPIGFYSLLGNDKLSIQGRALPFSADDQVPLGYKLTYTGQYDISLSAFDGLFETQNQGIYLEDTALGIIHDMRSGSYSFVAEAGVNETRFILRFTGGSALGVSHPDFNENSVIVYKDQASVVVNAGAAVLANVKIFDIRGRLIAEKDKISNTVVTFESLPETQEVLLVKITAENGVTVTKKLVY